MKHTALACRALIRTTSRTPSWMLNTGFQYTGAFDGDLTPASRTALLPGLAKWHSAKRLLQRLVDKGLLKHNHSKSVERDNKAHHVLPEAFKGVTTNGQEAKPRVLKLP